MLDSTDGRVLGALIEKQLTTPDTYPLSLNALVLACNQATNREPVMALGAGDVEASIARLKEQRLARIVHPSHGRSVTKYRQVSEETLELEPAERAVLALLLLRGPQTPGELRSRCERLHEFSTVADVDQTLEVLAGHAEPLVVRLERQPGQSQVRWRQLLAEEEVVAATMTRVVPETAATSPLTERVAELEARVARLEAALADLLG